MIRTLITILGLGLWAGGATAEDARLTPLRTADESRGYEAVGRIDLGPNSFCTGTLIAPDLVLTAAHCMYDSRTRAPRSVDGIEFRAGWRDGRALAYRGIRRAILHPEYALGGSEGRSVRVANDLALLELDRPIRTHGVEPFRTAPTPRKGEEVGVISYAIHREERPSLERMCDVLARPSQMLVISCTVDFGASGAPILSFTDGEPRVVSVVSAKAEAMGRPVSLGTDLEGALTELLELARTVPVVTPRIGTAGTTAKFIRP